MAKAVKSIFCVIMSIILLCSMSACSSSNKMSEENVTQTVGIVSDALREFDQKKLEKYVESSTLDYILKLSKGHEQFAKLGTAIFENLSIEIESIDHEANTVTISVKNKALGIVASKFATKLLSEHSKFQLIQLLGNDSFLDTSLGELTEGITDAKMREDAVSVTLKIKQGKKNLVLCFDEDAENAVSGGALGAITGIVGK